MPKVIVNLVLDHHDATALRAGQFTPPILFMASLLDCGHWQLQDDRHPATFVHEGGELACEKCAAVEARELVGSSARAATRTR